MLRRIVIICFLLLPVTNLLFAQPIIRVEPNIFQDTLLADEVVDHELTIANDGDETLEFEIRREYDFERERWPGWLGVFEGINAANEYCSPIGWDRDNEWMWISNYSTGTVAAFSYDGYYEDFEERVRLQDPGQCMDGTFANGMVYIGTLGDTIVGLWDAEGERVGNIEFPYPVYGLAADQEAGLLFAMTNDQYAIYVYEFDDDGGIGDDVGVIEDHLPYHANVAQYGFEWVGEQADGQLWITNHTSNSVYQILVDTDEWECVETVQRFSIGEIGQMYNAIAHDGENIWVGGYEADNIRIYNDGIIENDWLQYEMEAGEAEPNEEVLLPFTVDAHNLSGYREVIIYFYSNDPELENFSALVSVELIHEEESVDNDGNELMPDEFKIQSIYPNPFNSTTNIIYHLPTETQLDLGLYDISGREVIKLYSGVCPAGDGHIIVDAKNLTNGVYVVNMRTKKFTSSQKLVVIK